MTACDLSRQVKLQSGPGGRREGRAVVLGAGVGRAGELLLPRGLYLCVSKSKLAQRTHFIILNISFYDGEGRCLYGRTENFSSGLTSS